MTGSTNGGGGLLDDILLAPPAAAPAAIPPANGGNGGSKVALPMAAPNIPAAPPAPQPTAAATQTPAAPAVLPVPTAVFLNPIDQLASELAGVEQDRQRAVDAIGAAKTAHGGVLRQIDTDEAAAIEQIRREASARKKQAEAAHEEDLVRLASVAKGLNGRVKSLREQIDDIRRREAEAAQERQRQEAAAAAERAELLALAGRVGNGNPRMTQVLGGAPAPTPIPAPQPVVQAPASPPSAAVPVVGLPATTAAPTNAAKKNPSPSKPRSTKSKPPTAPTSKAAVASSAPRCWPGWKIRLSCFFCKCKVPAALSCPVASCCGWATPTRTAIRTNPLANG